MMGATEECCGLGCGIRAKTPGTDPRTGTSRLFATATVFRVLTDNVVRTKKKDIGWGKQGNRENCVANAHRVTEYARRFTRGQLATENPNQIC